MYFKTNKPFPFLFIACTFFGLLSNRIASSTLLQTVVETQDHKPVDQMKSQHMFLSHSSPSTRSLDKDQIDYYEIFISSRDNRMAILKEDSVGKVELFVSLDPNNKYPNEKEHTYTTKTTSTNWIGLKIELNQIELNKTDLTKACLIQSATLCAIYVAVIPQGTAVSYSISLERDFSKNAEPFLISPLKDGQQLTLPVPADNSPVNYYFYTLPFEPCFVTAKTHSHYRYKEVIAYAKILDRNTKISSLLDMDMPTYSSYDYVSEGTKLNLPAGAPVLVVLSLSFKDTNADRHYRDSDSPDYYFISLESQIMPLTLGKQHNSTILPDQYRYFSVYVGSECNLLVSAKSHDDQDLSLVIAPPYRDELPTIENTEFEERELYGAKFYEIDIRKLVGGRYSSFGTWAIGVYGESSSEFSLIAVCGGHKIMQLQRDMIERVSGIFSKNESPIYFLYKPETKNSISMRLNAEESRYSSYKKTKDTLFYYIRQISKDENFIFNLPNKMNYQWSSFTDIDRKTCDDCLYLIAIEGIFSHSNFIATISEPKYEIVETTNGSPVNNSLLPEDSRVIALLEYSQPDIYISITSEAEKLELYASNKSNVSTENYFWKMEMACNSQTQVLKLPSFHSSSKDSKSTEAPLFNLYLQIRNPTSQNVSYTILIITTDDKRASELRQFTLNARFTQPLILYTSKENETIELNVDAHPGYSRGSAGEFDLDMKAYYWPEDIFEVPAIELSVSKISVINDVRNPYRVRYPEEKEQIFKMNSKRGKFVFLITHNANKELIINVKIDTFASDIQTLDENSQTDLTLIPGQIQVYNFSLNGPGIWYLSGYSCNGISVDLRIQNDSKIQQTNIIYEHNIQIFHQAAINEEGSNHVIKLALSENQDMTGFTLRSTFLPKAVPYYDYLKKDFSRKSMIKVNKDTGVISVEIYPLEFYGYDVSQDTVFYEVLVCPGRKSYLCGIGNDCIIKRTTDSYLEGGIRETYIIVDRPQPEERMEFNVQKPGEYSVIAIAHIKSQGQEIRNIIIGRSWETIPVINRSKQKVRQDSIDL